MTSVLIKREKLEIVVHTGIKPYEHEDRDWSYDSTSQETPKIFRKPAEAGQKAWGRFFVTDLRRKQL